MRRHRIQPARFLAHCGDHEHVLAKPPAEVDKIEREWSADFIMNAQQGKDTASLDDYLTSISRVVSTMGYESER